MHRHYVSIIYVISINVNIRKLIVFYNFFMNSTIENDIMVNTETDINWHPEVTTTWKERSLVWY